MSIVYDPPEPDFQTAASIPVIPHSRECEEGVLGAVLINPNCLYDLAVFLRAEHFFIHRNRFVWEAMTSLEMRRVPIDLITLADELERKGQLADIGGAAYLTKLIADVPSSLNAESYGHIVEAHAVRRLMIAAANKIAQIAYNENMVIEEALTAAHAETLNLELASNGNKFIKLGNLLSDVMDDVEVRSKDPKDIWGYSTGIPKFDKKTGGLQLGELVYLAGAPGVGKTWLDLGWGIELGKQAPGAILSLEMKKLAIGRRLLSGISAVSTRAMKSGRLMGGDWDKMTKGLEEFSEYPVYIDDSSYDTTKLRAALIHAKREFGLKWFILDYALLMMDYGRDETEQSKVISANIKRIVQDLDVCGVVLHSVTKVGMEDGAPKMSDQRGSGQAIHDPDVQLFLTQVNKDDPKLAGVSSEDKKKMATLWCTKGRDLEQSRFFINLVRKGISPFWGEYEDRYPEPLTRYRKDVDE